MNASDSRVTVRLSAELRNRLREEARRTGRRESDLIRDAVDKHLKKKRERSSYEVFKRAGLIGCIKDGPSDLATNKKYFEGFGKDPD
ncbi:MAG TPA: CopG family transcriptional regulator [Bryobacteraceae bacterium]|nr:CopG family transcriptional regulator [Bryobacteraceae bacterium]